MDVDMDVNIEALLDVAKCMYHFDVGAPQERGVDVHWTWTEKHNQRMRMDAF